MRLERVEIVGFKSFCDRQELTFRGGVTGIVGPNGCGKSNISDAISWVLGEQSVKSLRGASMEDVIFAGSQSRQALAMAEVNLKVSGLNGDSPDGDPECMITRRLYRSGESEYLMNGRVCRLRDIHELFMDTGLGSKSYSIIEQGKIGLILSTKPADRRALIEEAAGITKYRARRRQTALKLEAAQQNLLRVNDIVHEVEKQLESLKRQASKARRYRAVRDEILGVERILFGRRFLEQEEQARSLSERAAAEAAREQAAAVVLETEEAQMEVRRNALYDEEAQLERARAVQAELTLALERHQGKIGYCQEQMVEAELRSADAAKEAGELEGRVGPLNAGLMARRAEHEREQAARAAADEDAQQAERALQEAAAAQASEEADLEHGRETQIALLGRIAALQNALASVSANAERAGADLVKLAGEEAELAGERTRVEAARGAARARSQEAESLLEALVAERDRSRERAEAARSRADRLFREADLLQSERDGLAGRLASLEEIVATHSAFDEGVRALMKGTASEDVHVLGVVADAVETDSVHERAVEAFLGERLQAVLVPDPERAVRGIRYLQKSGAGRGAFLPVDAARPGGEEGPLRELARREGKVRGLLSDFYRVTGPYAAAVRAALPEAFVVETLEDALDIVSRHGLLPCATLAGETLRGSMVEGGRGVKGLLAPRREIREIKAREQEIDARLEAVRAEQAGEQGQADAASEEARALDARIHVAEKDLVAIRHDLAAAEDEAARLERKATVLATERSQAEQERSAAALRQAELEHALVAGEAEREAGRRRLQELAGTVARARAGAEAVQARSSEARSRLAALRERVSALEAECGRLARDQGELADRIAAARARFREMSVRRDQLTAERAEAERQLAAALLERDRVAGDVARAEDRVRDVRNELEAREHSLKERRREREMLRDALSELEVARTRVGSDLEHLGRECRQAVGSSAAEAAASLTDQDRARDLPALEAEVRELRDRLERMGAVNVLAVEQAKEMEERHQFLTAQRRDLTDSITELESSIRKIDRTSRERFAEAFQAINQHFGEVFRRLFGGGSAGLSLIDEEDILESGIDVMAQPPGKRLQNVMLLSGGEKALTAIALLFAIFQYKPSPFCILDEVDAPLDDANIGRFVKMLEGLKDQTQFVLITHSRKTMEIADELYGVTMEEPGVSKLVSVRFG